MANHYSGCFACGSDHPGGLCLTAVAGDGASVSAHARITGSHQGAPGLAHGGIVAAVLDEAQGFLLSLLGSAAVTGKLEITYRRPVPIDSDVTVEAVCVGIAGRKIYTVATLYDGSGETVLAESAGLFIAVGEAHFAPYLERAAGTLAGRVGADDVTASIGRRVNP
jgi:acyl-coenzyme A thioesterase PaaI-like protein